jgi:hypothetical protein
MKLSSLVCGGSWWLSCYPSWRAYRRALSEPGRAQAEVLSGILRENADTEFGREHSFSEIDSPEKWRERVPTRTYGQLKPWLKRVEAGEQGVLMADNAKSRVTLLEPSSGSTEASKHIPYNRRLRAEFQAGIDPWIFEIYRQQPRLLLGPAYWSISPVVAQEKKSSGGIPIGFEEDSAYLSGFQKRLVDRFLAVPSCIRGVRETESFRYLSAWRLLSERELRLISVWSPSFLGLLLSPFQHHWESLLEDIATGMPRPPTPVDPSILKAFQKAPDPRRTEELAQVGPTNYRAIWPRLGLVSAWADAHAASQVPALKERFEDLPFEAKGLVATEGMVSLPFAGMHPLAIRSHFLEFEDSHGQCHGAEDLKQDEEYAVLLTTGGGLYRYRLQDRVLVDGFVASTPSIRFLGKANMTSDRCGEKLTEAFVSQALSRTWREIGKPGFAMLAPDPTPEGEAYTLFLDRDIPKDSVLKLEKRLRQNFHYDWCVRMGQIRPLRAYRVQGDAWASWYASCQSRGQRLGDIKPGPLDLRSGWSLALPGHYVEDSKA